MANYRYLLLAAGLLALFACSTPAQRIDAKAAVYGMSQGLITGLKFRHITYAKPPSGQKTLHIYLDGDGSPWLHGRYIASDPTPRNPLALELANLDTMADVVYLGRPCYLGLYREPMCSEALWTSARYSAEVVRSMAAAAQALATARGATSIRLIGYSGGGSLAMLMLAYMDSVDEVITIAANLDTERWAEYHRYLPLKESLNPIMSDYPKYVRYRHFVGEHDENVPVAQTEAFIAKHGGELVLVAGFGHRCCWRDQWPKLIQ